MTPLIRTVSACLLLLLPLAAAQQPVRAQEVSERSVKAAFLHKFPGFIQWTGAAAATADTPYVIGLIGADDMASELEVLAAGRRVENRPIAVRRLSPGESFAGVHVVFLGVRERGRIETVARAARAAGALLVTEWEGALREGALLNFVLVEGRVRFEVAVDAAEKNGLRLSSRLLSVAHAVQGSRP